MISAQDHCCAIVSTISERHGGFGFEKTHGTPTCPVTPRAWWGAIELLPPSKKIDEKGAMIKWEFRLFKGKKNREGIRKDMKRHQVLRLSVSFLPTNIRCKAARQLSSFNFFWAGRCRKFGRTAGPRCIEVSLRPETPRPKTAMRNGPGCFWTGLGHQEKNCFTKTPQWCLWANRCKPASQVQLGNFELVTLLAQDD